MQCSRSKPLSIAQTLTISVHTILIGECLYQCSVPLNLTVRSLFTRHTAIFIGCIVPPVMIGLGLLFIFLKINLCVALYVIFALPTVRKLTKM